MADIKKLEADLWEAADGLRANSKLTSQQYCMPVLGLIFLRYAWGRFKRVDAQIELQRAQSTGRQAPVGPVDYSTRGALFLPENARYDYLVNLPGNANVGKAVNDAMDAITKDSPQLAGVLPDTYTELGNDLLRDILRIFNNPELDAEGDDIVGRIYEYFLGKFAPAVASDDGVFFTPKSLVRMIMNIIEPTRGVMLDPACGSGGMFVSAADYVREHGGNPADAMLFRRQEKVEYNAKLCLMNMAVHGMSTIGQIKSGDEANSFYNDAFSLDGKCDYVAANPPFNVDKVKAERAISAGRLPLGSPKENQKGDVSTSGANYLWINYFYSYLNASGRAGFVMASSATDSNGEKRQRQTLVQAGHVDVLLYVGNNFFYTKTLPCTLWFLDKGKPEALREKVLFIDAQRYHTVVDTTHNEWSPWQLKNLAAIVWLYRGETSRYTELLDEYRAAAIAATELFASAAPAEAPEADEVVRLLDAKVLTALDSISNPADFKAAFEMMLAAIARQKERAKAAVEALPKREQKASRARYANQTAQLEAAAKVIEEAVWLTQKFGLGEYLDIPGLCKIATRNEIQGNQDAETSSWSLTPGAYVGVPPVEDDGIDFHQRMTEIHAELLHLQEESNDLMTTITKNFKELGL